MTPFTLPSGATVLLRDPKAVTERARRPILALSADMSAGSVMASREAGDYAILALAASWSLETPLTLDAVLDLPGPDYDALWNKAMSHIGDLMPSFDNTGASDPQSPTPPSAD